MPCRVTIAHQPVNTTEVEDNYYPDTENIVDHQHYNQLLAAAAAAVSSNEQWVENIPSVEDLTGEVQDLMLRESMNNWLQPWMAENANCLAELDNQMYAQSIQLEDLFGQDEMALSPSMMNQSLYDEISFVPEDISLTMSAPTSSTSSPNTSAHASPIASPITTELPMVEKKEELTEPLVDPVTAFEMPMKRRRGSSSSEDSSDDSSDDDDSASENEDVIIPTTVANLNSRRRRMSYSSDSDSDSEPNTAAISPVDSYMYMHKRQIEETLLDRITNNLNPEKLPGILSILASEKPHQQEDEVEIDLSCLAREQLVQVLFYVDACILEQNGGPVVNIEDFVMKKSSVKQEKPTKKRARRRPTQPRTKSRAELTENLDSSFSESEEIHPLSVDNVINLDGPISMASLTKKHKTSRPSTSTPTSKGRKRPGKVNRHRNRRKSEDDEAMSSVVVFQDPDSIASTRPKRRAAVHKRRLLEQMLAPSDNESDEETEDGMLVVYSDEKMDFNVVDNQTIAHSSTPIPLSREEEAMAKLEEEENDDEEIDIMC